MWSAPSHALRQTMLNTLSTSPALINPHCRDTTAGEFFSTLRRSSTMQNAVSGAHHRRKRPLPQRRCTKWAVPSTCSLAAQLTLEDDSETFACDITPQGKQRRIHTLRQPLTAISAITPFNHPLNMVAHKIAPAIATNNCVVLQPI